jgi:hypothetical protein
MSLTNYDLGPVQFCDVGKFFYKFGLMVPLPHNPVRAYICNQRLLSFMYSITISERRELRETFLPIGL